MDPQTPTSDIRSIIDPLPLDNRIKAQIWDTFQTVKTPAEFQQKFDSLNLPQATKAALWDAKFSGHKAFSAPKMTEASERARQLKGGAASSFRAEDLLPGIGMGIGGIVGAPGVVTGAAGAAAGGVLGQEAREIIQEKFRGAARPTAKQEVKQLGEQAATGAATELGGRVLAYPLKAAGKFFTRTAEASKAAGVPLLPSEAGAGPVTAWFERFSSGALPSRKVLEQFREGQQVALDQLADATMQKIGKLTTQEMTGDAVVKALEDSRNVLRGEQNKLYAAIDEVTQSEIKRVAKMVETPSSLVDEFGQPMTYEKKILEKIRVGGVQPSTKPLREPAVRLLREIEEQKQLMDPKLLADTEATLRAIMDAPENVPYQAMAKSRSDLLALTRKLDEALPGKRAGAAKLLAGAMDKSMMQAAERSGIPELPNMIREANAFTAEMHRRFEQALVKKALDTGKTETISAMVKDAGLQEIRDIYGLLPPSVKQNVKTSIIQDMLSKATDKTGNLNTKAFVKSFNKLGETKGSEIFGADYPKVKQMTDIFDKIKTGGPGEAAGLFNIGLVIEAIAAPHALVRKAGIYGGIYTLAKAITNPEQASRVLGVMEKVARTTPYAAVTSYESAFSNRPDTAGDLLKDAKGKPPGQQKKDLEEIQQKYSNPMIPVGPEAR